VSAVLVSGLFLVSGCGGSQAHNARNPKDRANVSEIRPVAVSDAEFAKSAYHVLFTRDPDAKRNGVLVGVVRRQLQRAKARFDAGHRDAGLAALRGAFYLIRAGEFHPAILEGAAPALEAGASEVSRLGQEGYAFALYNMLSSVVPAGPHRQEVDAHLRAMANFSASTRGGGVMQAAGADLRAASQRSLLEGTEQSLEGARDKLVAWLKKALDSNVAEAPIRSNFERDEALEAYRALRGGGFTLVALYLRHGDARGSLTAAEQAELGRFIPADLRDRLERAGDDDDPNAWADLHQFFDNAARSGSAEAIVDPDLMAGAAWGAALELFRSEPGSLQAAMPLAELLLEYGMGEVAPLVLAGALGKNTTVDGVSASMAVVLRAIVSEEENDQLDNARRTFANAEPILRAAQAKGFLGRVNPSAARLSYVMGALETRRGEIGRALALIQAAAVAEPSVDALTTLAAIYRQRKNPQQATATLDKVIELGRRAGDPVTEADAWLTKFEIYRDARDPAQAGKALETALLRVLDAQRLNRTGAAQARAERLLARVLEHYGDERAMRRATERAFEASSADARQLSATIIDAARRALTISDLQAARAAVQRAIDAGLSSEDMVYVALWLQLLEKKLNVPSDGSIEEAYATIDENSGWPAKLRAWARGKLTEAELIAAARDRSQRTEALFYTVMSRTIRGTDNNLAELEQVAQSEAIDLVEVKIARDLLALRAKAAPDLKLPANVDVP
jgi:tetratricopeptide (TPR) repeat protein